MQGRRLALIGVGGVGRRVAARAAAFGLSVVGFDPYLTSLDIPGASLAASLEEAVAEADFISLHAPLTAASRHLIDARAIAAMRRAPLIVNTARGGLVDHDALLAALDAGTVGGAALDVTEPEPLPSSHRMRTHPQVIITPHMAFYSVEAAAELRRRSADAVVAVLRGEQPANPVNRPQSPRR